MSVELIFRVGQQLIKTLKATHKASLTYNDLKPANILLSKDYSRITLIDFGFASRY